jgi:transposase
LTKVGKGTKVTAVTDGHGLPIGLYLAAANHHEVTLVDPTLKTIKVPQRRGRPKTRPKELAADKAYDSRKFRQTLRQRGIKAAIPTFERRKRKKPKRGRPIRVGESYQSRWKVERCFGWMDNCRRLVVRYDRHLHIYRSFCLLAIILWSIDRILN